MLRLTKVENMSFCDCNIYLGTSNDEIKNETIDGAAKVYKDAYGGTILNNKKVAESDEEEESR